MDAPDTCQWAICQADKLLAEELIDLYSTTYTPENLAENGFDRPKKCMHGRDAHISTPLSGIDFHQRGASLTADRFGFGHDESSGENDDLVIDSDENTLSLLSKLANGENIIDGVESVTVSLATDFEDTTFFDTDEAKPETEKVLEIETSLNLKSYLET